MHGNKGHLFLIPTGRRFPNSCSRSKSQSRNLDVQDVDLKKKYFSIIKLSSTTTPQCWRNFISVHLKPCIPTCPGQWINCGELTDSRGWDGVGGDSAWITCPCWHLLRCPRSHLALGLRSKWLAPLSSLSPPQGIMVFPACLCHIPITVAGWRNPTALWTEKFCKVISPHPSIPHLLLQWQELARSWGSSWAQGGWQDGGWIEPPQPGALSLGWSELGWLGGGEWGANDFLLSCCSRRPLIIPQNWPRWDSPLRTLSEHLHFV